MLRFFFNFFNVVCVCLMCVILNNKKIKNTTKIKQKIFNRKPNKNIKSRPNCFLHRSVPSSNNVAATTYHWPTSPILPPISSRTPHLVPDTHMSSNGSAVNNYTSSNKYGS